MACMDHECSSCGWYSCDNVAHVPWCPKCGGNVVSMCDEQFDRDDYDDDGYGYDRDDDGDDED